MRLLIDEIAAIQQTFQATQSIGQGKSAAAHSLVLGDELPADFVGLDFGLSRGVDHRRMMPVHLLSWNGGSHDAVGQYGVWSMNAERLMAKI